MIKKIFSFSVGLCTFLMFLACSTQKPVVKTETARQLPKASTEFRAAWVATVANINWPSKPGLSTEEQKKEAIALLDFLQQRNFNAVIFQVRPQADALYKSELEPWSYYLTGKQGQAPNPYYDPLEFWIEAAHDRGLELHVWLNPYRAHHVAGKELSEQSIVKRNPELVYKLKEGYWWLDPSKKGTQDHSAAVVRDLVKRYDLDGVHFDDYFYPYPSYNGNEDFPDSASYAEYQHNGGTLSRGDWRRQSVNQFIERVYNEIKAEKKHVKFGLSPFGIWRPGYPESATGFDQHEVLYADARLWLNKGWIDYFAPQLYWKINAPNQSFPELLGWWAQENTLNRHLWPGLNVGLGGDEKNIDETINQIMTTRGMLPKSKGAIHWSIGALTKHDKLATAIAEGPYKKQALVPPSPWLDNDAPKAPIANTSIQNDKVTIHWKPENERDAFRWVVYYQYGNNWNYKILNRKERSLDLQQLSADAKSSFRLNRVIVTTVDRVGNESNPTTVNLNSFNSSQAGK
ncbi:MAG TPA: family 10 glycosylhydrolase [Sphingobacteriaceae bacterium]